MMTVECLLVYQASLCNNSPSPEGASLQVHSFEGISNRESGVRESYHLSVLPVTLCETVGPVGPTWD